MILVLSIGSLAALFIFLSCECSGGGGDSVYDVSYEDLLDDVTEGGEYDEDDY